MKHYPLSGTEYGMYIEQAEKGNTANNLSFCLELDEYVDFQRLSDAVKQAVELHPALKTAFATDSSGEVYKYLRDCEVQVRELTMEKSDFYTLVKPFDLQKDILFRFYLIRSKESCWFFYDIHHIVFDGTSNEIFLTDINKLYYGGKPGEEIFGANEFAQEEKQRVRSEAYDSARNYYLKAFQGVDTDTSIFTDRNSRESIGKEFVYPLRRVDSAGLRRAADRFGVKLSTILNAGFAYVLSQYAGSEQVLYATVYHGRDSRLSHSVGMFIRTYPVCADLSKDREITEYLGSMDEQIRLNRENSLFSYADFCAETKLRPQVLFAYQGDLVNTLPFCGREVQVKRLPMKDAKEGFELTVRRVDGEFLACAEYDQSLYDDEIIANMLESFDKVLDDMLHVEKLSEICMLTDEQQKKLDELNRAEEIRDVTDIVTMFRRQAAKTPDQTAVVYLDQTLTYSELDQLTENIAAFLKQKGIGRGKVVSVMIPRSEYMPIASLGILKTGAAYQPLDPSYPVERLMFMIGDADASYLIADRSLMQRLLGYQGPVLYIDEIPALPDADPVEGGPHPDDLFITLYTSGSTGVPKGVMLEHRNLACFCRWYQQYFKLNSESRAATLSSYGFDANMMDLYPALTCGAQIHIIEEGIRQDLLAIKDYFSQNRITHSFMTTQVGRQYADIFPDAAYPHYLITGGEKLVPVKPPKNYHFYNAYGPTECTIMTNIFPVEQLYERVPVGRPLGHLKQYVVDAFGRRVPPGVHGELIIAGPQVGRGYLNRPDQNEKSFIPNPFSDEEGYQHAYRTGDMVRLLSNGCVDFIGRNDGQVKVRGFRIELSEVEGIIRRFPGIKDATVQAFDDSSGGQFIAAYVVSDEIVHLEALDAFILANKPPYMVPAVTIQLDKIPLTQNQKINKRALPVPEIREEDVKPPQNEQQKKIFDCIARVLGTTSFGIHTDIFFAGLTSIGALRLNVMLSNLFDMPVSLSDLRRHNTVVSLEKFLSTGSMAGKYPLQDDYPVTCAQASIFAACMAAPGSTVYHQPYLFRLSDRLELPRLKLAVEAAINAHPYLKTELFTDTNGELRAARRDTAAAVVELIRTDELPRRLVEPFSLLNSRLYRARIYETRQGSFLYLEFHQIISDRVSEAVMLEDINSAYCGENLTAEIYTGYEAALDEEKSRSSEQYDKARAYFDSLLSGTDPRMLPESDGGGEEKSTQRLVIPSRLEMVPLRQFCEQQGVTEETFFHCVFAFVLAKYCYKTAAVYITHTSGRDDKRLTRAVCMRGRNLPVSCGLDGSRSIAELLTETGEQLVNSRLHSACSFAELSRAYKIPGDVVFEFEGERFEQNEIGGEKAERQSLGGNEAGKPFEIHVYQKDGRTEFSCTYRSDWYSEDMIRGFVACMETAAKEFQSKKLLSEVGVMTAASRRSIQSFNHTETEVPAVASHSLFEDQVRRNPLKTAVIAGGEAFTYQQLNESANRIAHSLLEQEIAPEEPVAVMMPRVGLVYAVNLGVLKAGGAFVPLSPETADTSLLSFVRQSGARYVITTAALSEARSRVLTDAGVRVLTTEELLSHENKKNPEAAVPPERLCCCLMSEDADGRAKGVLLEHHSLTNLVNWNPQNLQACGFCDNMTVSLAMADLSSGVSVLEGALPLCHSGTVALATEEERRDPQLLAEMMKRNGVDVMKCTPFEIKQLLSVPESAEVLRQLKAIDISGGVFRTSLYDRIRAAGITAKLHHGYGTAETTMTAVMEHVTGGTVKIGRPLCNSKAAVLDPYGNELPLNVPGELTILGEGVGRGYAGGEAMTKERFVTCQGLPAFRTGDLACWGEDGKLRFLGRLDRRVRLHGQWVALDAVEAVMNDHPAVTRSLVLLKKNDAGEEYLCAYYTAAGEAETEVLKAFLCGQLDGSMVPAVFVRLEAFPVNASGRINEHELTETDYRKEESAYHPPVTELQRKLCDYFADALGCDRVGIDDDFFALGGTSLKVMKIVMRAAAEELPVTFRDVLDHPTAAALEKHLLQGEQSPEEEQEEEEVEFDTLLRHNSLEYIREIRQEKYGNVLLTGATGFLGIHVLKKLLDNTDKTVYCLIRQGSPGAEVKLRNMLMYYFESMMEPMFSSRVRVLEGDIGDKEKVLSLGSYDFDTVINCASCVKQEAQDDLLERINFHGVQNLIDLCVQTNRRLVQISTVSVAGVSVDGQISADKRLHENELFFGQNLDNKYLQTKFRAEQAVLRAVIQEELNGRIIRVGNLMSRCEDGAFQINSVTSNFMSCLRSYASIGKISVSMMDELIEFSPVDCTAEAIVTMAGANRSFTVFHATNGHRVEMGDVIEAMNRVGVYMEIVDDMEYAEAFHTVLSDDHMNNYLLRHISCLASDETAKEFYIGHDNAFTVKALYRLGYKWPIINETYLKNVFVALENLGYFDGI